jgi:hypothetical protein
MTRVHEEERRAPRDGIRTPRATRTGTVARVLSLQQTAGNSAVSGLLGRRSRRAVARKLAYNGESLTALSPSTGAGAYRQLVRLLDQYAALDDNDVPGQSEKLRELRTSAQDFVSFLVHNKSDPAAGAGPWVQNTLLADVTSELTRLQQQTGPVLAREEPFPQARKYSFEWWFNYFAAETRRFGAATPEVDAWAAAYHGYRITGILPAGPAPVNALGLDYQMTDAGDKFRVLDSLLNSGMIAVPETDVARVVPLSQAHVEGQDEEAGYPRLLPDLQTTGLVYRSDSRKPTSSRAGEPSIQAHGGSKPRTRQRQNNDEVLRSMNMLEQWNPLKHQTVRESLLVRLGKQDNDLNAVVSIAADPRDAVKFPLPGGDLAGGGQVQGTSDVAHLYVIYIPLASRVLDTSRVISEETETRQGHAVDWFGRGELGSPGVTFEQHLLHLETDRGWATSDSEAYVVGKVRLVEPLNQNVWATLPQPTQDALQDLLVKFGAGGALQWLVHGKPAKGNVQHQALEERVHADRALTMYPHEADVIDWPNYTIKVRTADDALSVDVSIDSGPIKGGAAVQQQEALRRAGVRGTVQQQPRRDGRDWYFDWRGYKQGEHKIRAVAHYANGRDESAPVRTITYSPPNLSQIWAWEWPKLNAQVNGGSYDIKLKPKHADIAGFTVDTGGNGTVQPAGKDGDLFVLRWTGYTPGRVSLKVSAVTKDGGVFEATGGRSVTVV